MKKLIWTTLFAITLTVALPTLPKAETDIAQIEEKARQGNASAQSDLCFAMNGVKKQNLDWCETRALSGDTGASNNLAKHYELGDEVPKDLVQAYAWYSMDQGNFEPLDRVAALMSADDITKAEKIYATRRNGLKDAKKKQNAGVLCVWNLYINIHQILNNCPSLPNIVTQDLKKAYFWAVVATRSPNPSAPEDEWQHEIGKLLTRKERTEIQKDAGRWQPTLQGDGVEDLNKGYTLEAEKDEKTAAVYLEKSADTGNAKAQRLLAKLYFLGLPPNLEQFNSRLDIAIQKLALHIAKNSVPPIDVNILKDKAAHARSPFGCLDTSAARGIINRIAAVPAAEFEQHLEETLSSNGIPQMEPCF